MISLRPVSRMGVAFVDLSKKLMYIPTNVPWFKLITNAQQNYPCRKISQRDESFTFPKHGIETVRFVRYLTLQITQLCAVRPKDDSVVAHRPKLKFKRLRIIFAQQKEMNNFVRRKTIKRPSTRTWRQSIAVTRCVNFDEQPITRFSFKLQFNSVLRIEQRTVPGVFDFQPPDPW